MALGFVRLLGEKGEVEYNFWRSVKSINNQYRLDRRYVLEFLLELGRTMSPSEVGAAVSVLLGLEPPVSLSETGSSKLNEVLMPNPFDRPRAAFVLEVTGVKDLLPLFKSNLFTNAFTEKVISGSDKAEIRLPEEEALLVSLDEPSASDFASLSDDEIGKFASWMGGSYVTDMSESLKGELTFPLGNGRKMSLHMSKEADRQYIGSLISLVHGVRRAKDMHEDFSQGTRRPAELIKGCFDGIKVLKEEHGTEGFAEQGLLLLLATLSRSYDLLQEAYKGQIVGVILLGDAASSQSDSLLDVTFTSRPSVRWLAESEASANATKAAEVALVRLTLAWVTGLILLISVLLGVYLLLNMPLTRDTLLYSNVKLD
ncbi:uncharacterized protein LOC104453049 [Eucalyptus grandis]|uniref:uncharacterized protein LOC104453049 n=1 Tax=Eucalyptus grandis TaxID=71139 RepID=UPI00192EEE9C|nr:uncharacterized protein LOC104453049 [Eucalyptus grandis]